MLVSDLLALDLNKNHASAGRKVFIGQKKGPSFSCFNSLARSSELTTLDDFVVKKMSGK
jgi:hypothetical protein